MIGTPTPTLTGDPRLVLIAHGSPSEPRAVIPVYDHADAIRSTGQFDGVDVAFVKGRPSIADVVGSTDVDGGGDDRVVVPLFVSDGYFAGTVIPDRLEKYRRPDRSIAYTPPVGTHPSMAAVIRRRAAAAIDERRGPVGLALVGHGSASHSAPAAAVKAHADRIRSVGPFTEVRAFFLEEAPRIETIPAAFDSSDVVVVPVFMAVGPHVREDVPSRIDRAIEAMDTATDCRVRYTSPVGTDPAVAGIVLDRATTRQLGEPTASGLAISTPRNGSGHGSNSR